jgi:probable F420-dependent oxidoreductase
MTAESASSPMKFGVVLPIWQLSVAQAETLALKAEEFGFDGVFVPDHILAKPATTQHYGPSWPDPFSLLAFLAGRTRRIQVGASVIVLPYRHPLVTAKAAATVDQVSSGRFIFGVGVGWDEQEFRDLGLGFRERGAIADEYIRIIKAAWANDVPSFSGKYFSFSGATFAPRPLQKPHPPIWVGGSPGTLSSPAMRRAVQLCDAWHPLGLTLDDLEKGIAKIREMAAKAGRSGTIGFAPRNSLTIVDRTTSTVRPAFEGSPDEIGADIRRARALGCDYLTFDLPRGEVAGMVRAMERFVKEVRPTASVR